MVQELNAVGSASPQEHNLSSIVGKLVPLRARACPVALAATPVGHCMLPSRISAESARRVHGQPRFWRHCLFAERRS